MLGNPAIWPSVQLTLGLNVFILTSYWIEKYLLASGFLNEWLGRVLIALNCASVIFTPAYVVYSSNVHPIGSSVALSFAAQVFLKLVSYHMVNYWCRKSLIKKFHRTSSISEGRQQSNNNNHRRNRSFSHTNLADLEPKAILSAINNNSSLSAIYCDTSNDKVSYPDNLNCSDIYYFMFVPTLCYELNFPRSQRIRKRFLIRRGLEMVCDFFNDKSCRLIQNFV